MLPAIVLISMATAALYFTDRPGDAASDRPEPSALARPGQPATSWEQSVPDPAGPAGGLQRAGRWFVYDGRPVYFAAFDTQELACDPTIDYRRALDLFVRYGINKTRIWIYCWFGTTSFGALTPWTRDARGIHNLDQFDPAYWQRLRDFVAEAKKRDIVVEVSIFAPNEIDAASTWSSERIRTAWNRAFNTNGVFRSNARGHFSPQFFDLNYGEVSQSGRRLRDYQQMLVDKAVAELGSFTNVYFEVANEFPVKNADIRRAYPWQRHWAARLRSAAPRLVAVHAHEYVGDHVRGIQYFWDESAIDVLDFRFATSDPKAISSLLHVAQTRGKILQDNEGGDPYKKLDQVTRRAWGFFMAGAYFALYEDDSSRIGSSGWIAGARRMKALRDIAEAASFWELSPVDEAGETYDTLVSQGPSGPNWRVMARPGTTYLVYFWGSKSSADVQMRLASGDYAYTWYDPRTAAVLKTGSVAGGAATIAAPPVAGWDADTGLTLLVTRR